MAVSFAHVNPKNKNKFMIPRGHDEAVPTLTEL